MRRRRLLTVLLVATSVVLAEGGNLIGNLAADQVPSGWKPYALPLLAFAAGSYVVANVLLFTLEPSEGSSSIRSRRSINRRLSYFLLSLLLPALGAASGFLANVAAPIIRGDLTATFGRARPLDLAFAILVPVLVLLAVLFAALLVRLQGLAREQQLSHRRFLNKLRRRYTRLLDDSLQGAALIRLGLRESDDEVVPLDSSSQTAGNSVPNAESRAGLFPPDTTVTQAYDTSGGHLLILGEPGSGKTTLLVELALDLLQRAYPDRSQPTPVLCNLATWAINRLPVERWLVEELVDTYHVPKRLAQEWLLPPPDDSTEHLAGEARQIFPTRRAKRCFNHLRRADSHHDVILPLLDGLDEIEQDDTRAACVQAINTFRHAHPMVPLVVCSRSAEYMSLSTHVALKAAITVQPLSDEQVSAYLAHGGEQVAWLYAEVESDPHLREILRTPLLLRVLMLTYLDSAFGTSSASVLPSGDPRLLRQKLFANYTAAMLRRRRSLERRSRYSLADTQRYLAWLAAQMRAHDSIEYDPTRLTFVWLPDAPTRRHFRRAGAFWLGLLALLGGGLLGGLVGALATGPLGNLNHTLVGALLGGLAGACNGVAVGTLSEDLGENQPLIQGMGSGALIGLAGGTIVGYIVGMLLSNDLLSAFSQSREVTLVHFGLILGAGIGLAFGVLLQLDDVRDDLNKDLPKIPTDLLANTVAVTGLCILVGAMIIGAIRDGWHGVLGVLFAAISIALWTFILACIGMVIAALYIGVLEALDDESWTVFAFAPVLGAVLGGLVGSTEGTLESTLIVGMFGILAGIGLDVVALISYVFGSLWITTGRLILHVTMNRSLQRAKVMPSHPTRFLDFAVDHALLMRIDGNYRFIHILLRNYFADLYALGSDGMISS